MLPHEYAKYCTHLKSLDPESKTFRFGHAVGNDFIDTLCDRFQADTDHNILFCVENEALEFVAIGHIALAGRDTELAFSVLQQHQGCGLGNLLIKRCIQWCRTHRILSAYMVCISTNTRIRHLCAKHGIKVTNQDGEMMARIEIPAATVVTFAEEFASTNLATVDYFSKRLARPWSY